jgi:hypothetical protein
MISGIQEQAKPISLKINNEPVNTQTKVESKPEVVEPALEPNPPIGINSFDGDW